MYHIFLGAPRAKKLLQSSQENIQYTWTTIPSYQNTAGSPYLLPPPATLEAASRRISLMYQNAIFQNDESEEEPEECEEEGTPMQALIRTSTLITWAPTPMDAEISKENTRLANSRSFINTTTRLEYEIESQETQESQSFNYSDSSSIANFPKFHFNLHSITSLAAIQKLGKTDYGSTKVNVLLAVLEVEGPDTIRTKKGPDAGQEISILKMILGDEDGSVCRLTAWREIADVWGGSGPKDLGAKRGDVVLIENVTASHDPSTSPTLSASSNLKSRIEVCYRTMPNAHEDLRLRPDLRLGGSDASVRKVASIVRWFEKTAGLVAE
ncbi:hypothetical protein DFJ43DRAFT_1001562 [Lentinula guzmanii]|uniref:Shieldin complex subunit 2 first OB fold domain-containing protein n=2 Tax=Lentinula TaxID=5352 RepID=A0AA38MXU0_9AGAR|nr:hypothetical protein DFJ43DRAFT_1001562 [Lentinula guzmanii]KAJ3782847.1 hypothetical protein GGU10DRAFT_274768 [Lentinula aff. detonsa]